MAQILDEPSHHHVLGRDIRKRALVVEAEAVDEEAGLDDLTIVHAVPEMLPLLHQPAEFLKGFRMELVVRRTDVG